MRAFSPGQEVTEHQTFETDSRVCTRVNTGKFNEYHALFEEKGTLLLSTIPKIADSAGTKLDIAQ